jgi:hypothetical protein
MKEWPHPSSRTVIPKSAHLGFCSCRLSPAHSIQVCNQAGIFNAPNVPPCRRRKYWDAYEKRRLLWRGLAEGAGFEPAIRFPAYTLSRRAPSAARPPLRLRSQRMAGRYHWRGSPRKRGRRGRAERLALTNQIVLKDGCAYCEHSLSFARHRQPMGASRRSPGRERETWKSCWRRISPIPLIGMSALDCGCGG